MTDKDLLEQIEETATADVEEEEADLSTENLLSTGSTVLNVHFSGNPHGGLIKGQYAWYVGNSDSGKTIVAIAAMAEAANNPAYSEYALVYDNAENASPPIKKLFGKKLYERVIPPSVDEAGAPVYSSTVEEFHYHVADLVDKGKPFIYVLDSMDALSSDEEVAYFQESKDAHEAGKSINGSYNGQRAKKNSQFFRKIAASLKKTGSVLIIISQTRDNVTGFGVEKKRAGGGNSLKFYTRLEAWFSHLKTITKTHKGQPRNVGIESQVNIKKNHHTGIKSKAVITIYHSYGIDDIGDCIEYLLEEGVWKKSGQSITADTWDFKGTKEKLIEHIENKDLLYDLRELVGKTYCDVQDAISLKRKKRYE